jgi:hypothetical protein
VRYLDFFNIVFPEKEKLFAFFVWDLFEEEEI